MVIVINSRRREVQGAAEEFYHSVPFPIPRKQEEKKKYSIPRTNIRLSKVR